MTEDLRALSLEAFAASRASSDPDYPLIHVVPTTGRLNDPNGLLVDGEEYHAFYQLSPFHRRRKLVYWGHSVSRDLLHWESLEPAIVPDSFYDRSGAYSGNAVVLEPTEASDAPDQAPYQLFFTGNLKDPVTDERTASQCLLTSHDLTTFAKWPANPLIPTHAQGYTAHYRDPQVWRDPDRPGEYRMILGAQRENLTGAAVLYRSTDLLSWTFEGELSFPDAGGAFDDLGYMWECPGFVRLRDEVDGQDYDVLIWCPQGIQDKVSGREGFGNVFACTYTVGHLVGNELRDCDGTLTEVDRGFEFYAPQAFARRPSEPGPVLLTAWAGNAGEDDQPSIESGGWVHCLTVPRALSLRGGRLVQRPVAQVPDDAAQMEVSGHVLPAGALPLRELEGHRSWHLVLEAEPVEPSDPEQPQEVVTTLTVGDEPSGVEITLVTGGEHPRLVVDRSRSRYTQHGDRRVVSLAQGTPPAMEVIHDRSVTEIILADGEITFTLRTFVTPSVSGAVLSTSSPLRITDARAVLHD